MTCITLIVGRVPLEQPGVKCLAQGHNADRALSITANPSMWLSTEHFSTKTYGMFTSRPNSAWDSKVSLKIISFKWQTHNTKMDPHSTDVNDGKMHLQLHKFLFAKHCRAKKCTSNTGNNKNVTSHTNKAQWVNCKLPKGIAHPKMKILSSFIHPHIPKLQNIKDDYYIKEDFFCIFFWKCIP